jgi:hypothetical protein
VRDEIDRLRGEPTSEDRCLAALRRYLAEPGPSRLAELREAYLAVPEHLRMFLLGDMDAKDIPLRQLLTPAGKPLIGLLPGPRADYIVTEAGKQAALEYFADWTRRAEPQERALWTDPDDPPASAT